MRREPRDVSPLARKRDANGSAAASVEPSTARPARA